MLAVFVPARAQKVIEYRSGLGTRDPGDGDVWILYRNVHATHDGMVLESDSAHYNTRENSFTAFRNVAIQLSDTTFIYGDRLFYNGDTRVLDIWADTVVLIDGGTQLLANHLTYQRNSATAFYTEWGHGTSGIRSLYSKQGQYNSELKQFYIYTDVVLGDTSSTLYTDTLLYNTNTSVAVFESPTHIVSDSSHLYSELGEYNTDTRQAASYKASFAKSGGRTITSDTLFYDEVPGYGRALGNVVIFDSANDLTCTGLYGETSRSERFSLVTGRAHVLYVDDGDSLFLHADTIFVVNDTADALQSVRASHHVKAFRSDAQAMCDSAFYSATDSVLWLHQSPVLWYEHYQCSADTIELHHDSSGVSVVYLRGGCFAMQQVDRDKFNQMKGLHGEVHFREGEPDYADIIGNAQMVFYMTEDDSVGNRSLLGVNAGVGSSIRIYFDSTRAAERVVTYDKPDMQFYPIGQLPEDLRRLKGFEWRSARRPRQPGDVFVW